MGNEIIHVGPISSGIKMKLVNNYMSMVGMVMTAETLAFAKKVGIQQEKAVNIIQKTAAGKGQINVNFPKKVLSGDITPDFPLKMGLKDISLALSLGAEFNMPLKLGNVSKDYYSLAAASERSNQDCTAILHLIEDIAEIDN
jgi:4-hydroxybutyrate dehydrogenase/sulfolactaldehyde 3-reductase